MCQLGDEEAAASASHHACVLKINGRTATGCNALREEGSQSLEGHVLSKVSCWVKGPPDPLSCLVAPPFFLLFLGSFEQKAVQALYRLSPFAPAGAAGEPVHNS